MSLKAERKAARMERRRQRRIARNENLVAAVRRGKHVACPGCDEVKSFRDYVFTLGDKSGRFRCDACIAAGIKAYDPSDALGSSESSGLQVNEVELAVSSPPAPASAQQQELLRHTPDSSDYDSSEEDVFTSSTSSLDGVSAVAALKDDDAVFAGPSEEAVRGNHGVRFVAHRGKVQELLFGIKPTTSGMKRLRGRRRVPRRPPSSTAGATRARDIVRQQARLLRQIERQHAGISTDSESSAKSISVYSTSSMVTPHGDAALEFALLDDQDAWTYETYSLPEEEKGELGSLSLQDQREEEYFARRLFFAKVAASTLTHFDGGWLGPGVSMSSVTARPPLTPRGYWYGAKTGGRKKRRTERDTGAAATGKGKEEADEPTSDEYDEVADLRVPSWAASGEATVVDLPVELLLEIFKWLRPEDLGRAVFVCHTWRIVAMDEVLWRRYAASAEFEATSSALLARNVTPGWRAKLPGEPCYHYVLTIRAREARAEREERNSMARRAILNARNDRSQQIQRAQIVRSDALGQTGISCYSLVVAMAVVAFTVLLALQLDGSIDLTWNVVFSPLYAALGVLFITLCCGYALPDVDVDEAGTMCCFGLVLLFVAIPFVFIACKLDGLLNWHWAVVLIPTYIAELPVAALVLLAFAEVVDDMLYEGGWDSFFKSACALFFILTFGVMIASNVLVTLFIEGQLAPSTTIWEVFSPFFVQSGLWLIGGLMMCCYQSIDGYWDFPLEAVMAVLGIVAYATMMVVLVAAYSVGAISSFFYVLIPIYIVACAPFSAVCVLWIRSLKRIVPASMRLSRARESLRVFDRDMEQGRTPWGHVGGASGGERRGSIAMIPSWPVPQHRASLSDFGAASSSMSTSSW
ncbi:uncharacterized protein AMSG_06972 [Thecamonas trahens ATCC 50062]|uniref:F-box domain-containing protein n=1 Tax=Thecamonas trahens ATCC 50062 TaxID=461836 RepID=A0A0L0DFD5_THETB|nr:hypothetical protein AMSG_06972 [Thecamonas trahens ATCC 50062]KNC50999.1 hypothetical protein AMSG_06972 [Thecamonas trahens ATCC 50062]|eukprot:XP_013756468.1 hypothetical protein AMSG_06972 [Thecamonas trahens ATCC 50062]